MCVILLQVFFCALIYNKFFSFLFSTRKIFIYIFYQFLSTRPPRQSSLFFFKLKRRCLHKSQRRERIVLARFRGILKHKIGTCQIIIVSRRYLSRVHGDESSILLTLMLLDRRAKWPQRIPFSRSTVVTFGGPKFLTLQITSTRKRKSAVYFVCGQSGTQSLSASRASSMLMKRGRKIHRILSPLPIRFYCTHNYFCASQNRQVGSTSNLRD